MSQAAQQSTPLKQRWLALKAEKPEVKAKDGADLLGVSEAEMLAALSDGEATIRLDGDMEAFAKRLVELGETISLTRNEGVVIERMSAFRRAAFYAGGRGLLVKEDTELHINFNHWRHAFATIVKTASRDMASLQIFDIDGNAVHKLYLRENSNRAAYDDIVRAFRAPAQGIEIKALKLPVAKPTGAAVDRELFLAHWESLRYPDALNTLIGHFGLSRQEALECAKGRFTRELLPAAYRTVIERLAETGLRYTASAGNPGCRQVCTVVIKEVNETGPFINAHEPNFHMHVRKDKLASLWAVTLPARDGAVTQLELYDAGGNLTAFLACRADGGLADRDEWRTIITDMVSR